MTTLAAQPRAVYASLVQALEGPAPEQALEHAFAQLKSGGDVPLLMAMIQALLRSGLAGIAARLLQSSSPAIAADLQFSALLQQLKSLPSGEVDSKQLEARFERNRALVIRRQSELNASIPAFDTIKQSVRVFVSRQRNVHVVREHAARRLDLLFPFADHRGRIQGASLPDPALGSSYLLVGVPVEPLLARLGMQQASNGYRPPIDIVEPDANVFAAWLMLIEDERLLLDDRLALFVGANAIARYEAFLDNHDWRLPVTHCLTNFRPGWNPPVLDRALNERLMRTITARKQARKVEVDHRYANKNAPYWRCRFTQALAGSGAPLRVAGFTTRYSTVIQHAMRDVAAAFRRCGCVFDVIKQPTDSCATVNVLQALLAQEYDLIFVINHLRFEFAEVMPRNVPYVGWIQDHMQQLCAPAAGQSVGDLDLVIGHAPHVMASLYDYPLNRFIASNNLTDVTVYSDKPAPARDLDRFRCDLSYIGHGADTPLQLIDEIVAGNAGPFRQLLCAFISRAARVLETEGWINSQRLVELMLEAERSSGHPPLSPDVRRAHIYPQIARLYDRMLRHETLHWAANWARLRNRSFRIYGKGWHNHPGLKSFAAGEVASGYELRCVYQGSRISLQVNGYSSLHQRLLDGLASGAFMISRFNPADFTRRPFATIQHAIVERGLSDLTSLIALRRADETIAAACDEIERLTEVRIALTNDRARQHQIQILRAGNPIHDLYSDDGLFQVLRDMRLIPARVAADLDGFDQTTFTNEGQMHALLDRFVDDVDAPRIVAKPMREAVIAHDTYDSLVGRILHAFAGEN